MMKIAENTTITMTTTRETGNRIARYKFVVPPPELSEFFPVVLVAAVLEVN